MLSLAKPEQLSPIPPNVLAFATAAEKGDVKNLKQLLTVSGVEINAVCNDIEETALHVACHGNQFESVDALLALGADPDRINIYGHTALHYACFEGSAKIVKRLLTKDVNVNVNAQTKKWRLTRRSRSRSISSEETERERRNRERRNRERENLSVIGTTALHISCCLGDCEIVQLLLSAPGIKVDIGNESNESPVMLARDYDVLALHQNYMKSCENFPIHSVCKVVLCGNSQAGKSTLTQSILKFLRAPEYEIPVDEDHQSCVVPLTTGIQSHDVKHKDGSMKVYDLAGHKEYYSSHSSCLEAISLGSPSTFLLLTDIHNVAKVKAELNYWATMIGNVCSKCPHQSEIIVVGTHIDEVVNKAELPGLCALLTRYAEEAVKKTRHHFAGFVPLNTTHFTSHGKEFFPLLLATNDVVRKNSPAISLSSHVLYAFLNQKVPSDVVAITLFHLLLLLAKEGKHGLSTNKSDIVSFLETLADKGSIMFFPNADQTDSWIVIKQDVLLNIVIGKLFAPASIDPSSVSSNTGIIPISELKRIFPKHDTDMIVPFMLKGELCHTVVDEVGASKTKSDCVFCPALVHTTRPSDVLTPENSFEWQICTENGDEFFTTRSLYAIIRRLSIKFTSPSEDTKYSKELRPFSRVCQVWNRGISWITELTKTCITFIVEMSDSFQCLSLVASASHKNDAEYPRKLKGVLDVLNQCLRDFCPSVAIAEFIRCPVLASTPRSSSTIVKLSTLRQKLLDEGKALSGVQGRVVDLEEWLKVEPQLQRLISNSTDEGMPPSNIPELKDLMNDVAAKVPSMWRIVGIQLLVPTNDLDDIQSQVGWKPNCNIAAFELVFNKWRELHPRQYTWRTVISALETPSVGALDLAAHLKTKY